MAGLGCQRDSVRRCAQPLTRTPAPLLLAARASAARRWSPRLDEHGNSTRGTALLRRLLVAHGAHYFANVGADASGALSPTARLRNAARVGAGAPANAQAAAGAGRRGLRGASADVAGVAVPTTPFRPPPPPPSSTSLYQRLRMHFAAAEGSVQKIKVSARVAGRARPHPPQRSPHRVTSAPPATLQRLLASGVPVNIADFNQRTPLHLACAEGRTEAAGLLLSHGADVNCRDRWARTPLSEALSGGHEATAALVSAHGGVRTHTDAWRRVRLRWAAVLWGRRWLMRRREGGDDKGAGVASAAGAGS